MSASLAGHHGPINIRLSFPHPLLYEVGMLYIYIYIIYIYVFMIEARSLNVENNVGFSPDIILLTLQYVTTIIGEID